MDLVISRIIGLLGYEFYQNPSRPRIMGRNSAPSASWVSRAGKNSQMMSRSICCRLDADGLYVSPDHFMQTVVLSMEASDPVNVELFPQRHLL